MIITVGFRIINGMDTTNSFSNMGLGLGSEELVIWGGKYEIGIPLIDNQHKELVMIINELDKACRNLGGEEVRSAFKDAMRRIVGYVRFHFSAEQEFLERFKYPAYREHVKEHESFIKDILEAARDFNEGKRFVPHHFVRTLRDWLLSHIAVADKQYAIFIADQQKKGLVTNI